LIEVEGFSTLLEKNFNDQKVSKNRMGIHWSITNESETFLHLIIRFMTIKKNKYSTDEKLREKFSDLNMV